MSASSPVGQQSVALCFADVEEDKFGGVTVHMKEESVDAEVYVPILQASLSRWRQQGKKGVWIKLPTHLANLVLPTLEEGFRYHHAEPDYLMLVRWLPETPDTIPGNASHTVGIGAFVMNDKNEVLVVQERSGHFKGIDVWKIPTGIVIQGEDVCVAAIREVKEETGIDTEFQEILSFHQSHQHLHGKSDLFFVCMLRPRGCYDIEKQESELLGAKWMQIEKYAAQPYNQEHESFKIIADICIAKSKGEYVGFSVKETKTSSGKSLYLYFNGQNLQRAVNDCKCQMPGV